MTHSAQLLDQAKSLLNKPKSVPFLTEEGTVAELRFASSVSAGECRNNPDATMKKYGFIKVLEDINETATALLNVKEAA